MNTALPPVVKQVLVRANAERAFTRFTAEIASWWPLASHSVFEGEAESVTFEGRVGGRIVECAPGGRECVWGTVQAWEPPRRVAFTWHPGRDAATAQDVEVTFTPEGERTRVRLVHKGFERLGEKDGRLAARAYPIGWVYVLGLYAERRGPVMAALGALTNVLLAVRAWRRPKQGKTGAGATVR